MKNPQIIAIIPARGGSKSIPRKNIIKLKGKPLIAWPIELAKSIKQIERIIVSTDDDEIMTVAKKYGAETPFKRPPILARDATQTLPVLQHCLKYLEKKENYKPDIIALLYPTSPFLSKKRVMEALDLFKQIGCNSVVTVIKDYGHFWKKENKKYKHLHPIKVANRQYAEPLYRENGAIYFSKYDVIMQKNKLIDETDVQFLIMEPDENIDIDTFQDLAKAQRRL